MCGTLGLVSGMLSGCTRGFYRESADREVSRLVRE
jgi:hypothetical protein